MAKWFLFVVFFLHYVPISGSIFYFCAKHCRVKEEIKLQKSKTMERLKTECVPVLRFNLGLTLYFAKLSDSLSFFWFRPKSKPKSRNNNFLPPLHNSQDWNLVISNKIFIFENDRITHANILDASEGCNLPNFRVGFGLSFWTECFCFGDFKQISTSLKTSPIIANFGRGNWKNILVMCLQLFDSALISFLIMKQNLTTW